MTDLDAIHAAILAEPAEDLHRLAYADALDENDFGPWGDMVRAQIELAKVNAGYAPRCDHRQGGCPGCKWKRARSRLWTREAKAMEWFCKEDMAAWFGLANHETIEPMFGGIIAVGLNIWLHFERGLVDRVRCSADVWLRRGDGIMAEQPVTCVVLTTEPNERDFGTIETFKRSGRAVTYFRWPGITFHLLA